MAPQKRSGSVSRTKPHGQILHLAELNTHQITRLNRAKTVVLLPGGILEQHGPYLPSFTDGYWNEQLTPDLATAIAARPGWTALLFPTIPLGNSGANEIGAKFSFPGTDTVRFETLRAIFMDLATELGEQGFQWIFILHGHGAPNHNRALDQASDYFRDTYGGHMLNLTGLMSVIAGWDGAKSEAERAEDGLPIHAGRDETSMMLHLHPNLVQPGYQHARPHAGDSMEDLVRLAQAHQWPGYFGSPRLAASQFATTGWNAAAQQAITLALQVLDGLDETTLIRFGDEMLNSPVDVRLDKASLKHEAKLKQRQDRWLKRKGLL